MQMARCTRCMEELAEGVKICPHCGYGQDSDVQPPNALKRSTILHGRYFIGNVIGQGGFGITYVGWDMTLEMKVAVKEYFPSGSASRTNSYSNEIQWDLTSGGRESWSQGLDRFLKEARKMAKLDSVPAIVRVRDAFSENQTAYIVMDFVEGDTLKKYLQVHGVMRYEECMTLLSPILDSLAVIHDRGFIHRDISPDNIMLQPDGSARLLDMGAAVDVRANEGHASMAVIKRNFSAPEQYMESESLGSWTDVYAMAATVYYCMTGKVVPEALEREFKKTPLYFDPNLYLPPHVIGALNDGLALNAENRIRDMREFKRRLTTPDEDFKPYVDNDRDVKPYPVVDDIQRTGQPERYIAAPQKEKPKSSGKLKRGLKITLITIAALFAMFVVTIMYYAFQVPDSDDASDVSWVKETTAETAGKTEEPAEEPTEPETETEAATEYENVKLSDLTYEKTTDGQGIILTGYSGTGQPYIKLPDEVEGLPVVQLGRELFEDNETLEKIILPGQLEYINSFAFHRCVNLKQVELPASLRTIYVGVFSGCTGLEYLELPEGLKEISLSAFEITGIKELTIPSTVEKLDGCTGILSIERLKIAPGNQNYQLVDGVLYNNDGTLTDFPQSRGGEFVVPPEASAIGSFAFRNTSLKDLTISGNVKEIMLYAVDKSDSLKRVVMEEGVEELGMSCFADCINLQEVTIPRSVKLIDLYAFDNCGSLESVTISRDCQVKEGAFGENVEINYYD